MSRANNAGVGQGRVLSPKLLTCVLQCAMANWRRRATVFDIGIDLNDGMPNFLDLRFADDICLFAPSAHETTV